MGMSFGGFRLGARPATGLRSDADFGDSGGRNGAGSDCAVGELSSNVSDSSGSLFGGMGGAICLYESLSHWICQAGP